MRTQFLSLSNPPNTFLGYFNTLETHSKLLPDQVTIFLDIYLAKDLQSLNNRYNFHISKNVGAKVLVEDDIYRLVIMVVGCEIIIR